MVLFWAGCEHNFDNETSTHLTNPPKFTLVLNMAVRKQAEDSLKTSPYTIIRVKFKMIRNLLGRRLMSTSRVSCEFGAPFSCLAYIE